MPHVPSLVSAKTGIGRGEVLEAHRCASPPPRGDPVSAAERADLRLVVRRVPRRRHVRTVDRRRAAKGGQDPHHVQGRGLPGRRRRRLDPKMREVATLCAGEVGYVMAIIKVVADTQVGDTITPRAIPPLDALPGFKEVKPMVFAGLYPVDADGLREACAMLEKLSLNDSAFFYDAENSAALGFGFRCGLPRAASYGDHPGTSRAGVRSRARHHGAVRGVSRLHSGWRNAGDR